LLVEEAGQIVAQAQAVFGLGSIAPQGAISVAVFSKASFISAIVTGSVQVENVFPAY
jgi:hypothetical protein